MDASRFFCLGTIASAILIMNEALGDSQTIGPHGIDSAGLVDFNGAPLAGTGVSIGQVESRRPGKPGLDNNSNANFGTIPEEVFLLDDRVPPTANSIDEIYDGSPPIAHATWVAGVMIGTDVVAPGVATEADLYAAHATFPTDPMIHPLEKLAISSQFIATRDNDAVRAINLSFNVAFDSGSPDGNS